MEGGPTVGKDLHMTRYWSLQNYGSGDSSQDGIPKNLQGNPGQAAIGKVGLILCTASSLVC